MSESDYERAWNEQRKGLFWHLFAILCGLPISLLAGVLPRLVQSQQVARLLVWLLAVAWGFCFVLTYVRYFRMRCPRCGRRFQFSWWHHHYFLGAMRSEEHTSELQSR